MTTVSMTVRELTESLKAEMARLNDEQLLDFATKMGVDYWGQSRAEVESECITIEQYAYTH